MSPLLSLLHQQFQVCSSEWERQQQVAAIKKMQVEEFKGGLAREYMITIACEGVLEQEFAKNLAELFRQHEKWLIIEEANRDAAMNALAFKILSRQGCMVEAKLGLPHRMFPFKAFRLLKNPQMATDLSKCEACMLDPYSHDLLQFCPGFQGHHCWQLLHLNACLSWIQCKLLLFNLRGMA